MFEKLVDRENIKLAIINYARHKHSRPSTKRILANIDDNVDKIRSMLLNGYKNAKHSPKTIYDGIQHKKRTIIVPNDVEQIVHHAVINVLKPIFQKNMYFHSYGSLPNKGGHKGKRVIKKWIRRDIKNTKYYLKMDIKKYFDSVSHEVLKRKLKKLIHDDKFLNVLFEIISVTETGIPLGFYTSQWLANWFLTELDNFIKERLRAVHYMRYMDDMVIFSSNKRKLHKFRKSIAEYLHDNLCLTLKGNWQVVRLSVRDLDYMGFRFFQNRTTLRKGILKKARRKAIKIKIRKITIKSARQMLSYIGWLSATKTYNFYLKYIKPNVNFQKLKRYVSHYEKIKKGDFLCGVKVQTATA